MKHIRRVTKRPAEAVALDLPVDIQFIIDVLDAMLTKKASSVPQQ